MLDQENKDENKNKENKKQEIKKETKNEINEEKNNKKEINENKNKNKEILKKLTKILKEFIFILIILAISNIYNFKNSEYIYKLNNIAPKVELFSILLILTMPIYFKIFKKDNLEKKIKSLFNINIIFYLNILIQKIFGSTVKILLSNIVFSVIFNLLLSIILNKIFETKSSKEKNTVLEKQNKEQTKELKIKNEELKELKIKNFYNASIYYISVFFLLLIFKENILSIVFKKYFIGVIPIYKTIFLSLIVICMLLFEKIKLNKNTKNKNIINEIKSENIKNEIKKENTKNKNQNKEINKTKTENKYITRPIFTLIILAVLAICFIVLNNSNIIKEKYIDTTSSKMFSLNEKQKEKIKKIDKKTYIYIKNNNVKEDIDLILRNIEKENKNVIYLPGAENREGIKYKLLNDKIKKEIDMFLEKTKKSNDIDKDYIYICPEKENGRKDVKTLKDPYRSNNILDSENIIFNTKIEILNALISSNKELEKIGIINNLENIDPRDYSKFIQDLELYNYSFFDVDLNEEVPEDFEMLFCILPKKDINEKEYQNLAQYMKKGGKLFLSLQSRNDLNIPNIDKITESYGAKFKDVQVLEKELKNRYAYQDEKGQSEKFKKLEEMYKKGSSLGEIDKLQKEIKQGEIKVNNDILINELSKKSEITEKFKKENGQVISLLPGIITVNNKIIKENNIKVDSFITTSENALTLDNPNPNLVEELNLDPYFKLAIDKGQFTIGINLKKEDSALTILTSTAPILNYVKTLNGEYNFYNEKYNREVMLNTVFKNLNNDYISYDREYLKLEKETDKNNKMLSSVFSILIFALLLEGTRKFKAVEKIRNKKKN